MWGVRGRDRSAVGPTRPPIRTRPFAMGGRAGGGGGGRAGIGAIARARARACACACVYPHVSGLKNRYKVEWHVPACERPTMIVLFFSV